MKICLILEGSYPYVHGGVSTWMHQYITEMKEHEFVLWVVGATHEQKGKFVYELPENVVEVHEVFLDYVVPDKEEDIEPQMRKNKRLKIWFFVNNLIGKSCLNFYRMVRSFLTIS